MQERPFDTFSPILHLETTETDCPPATSGIYVTFDTSNVPAMGGDNIGVQSSGNGEIQTTETPSLSSGYGFSDEASQNIPPTQDIPPQLFDVVCVEAKSKPDPNNALFNAFLGVNRLPRGQLTLGKELGHGAFGEVYQGQWGDRVVALKKIDVAHAQESLKGAFYGEAPSREHIMEGLQWEVSRISTVSHPNIVQFYGIYQAESEGHTYVVMEFCTGGTLDRALQEKDVPWSKRWQWVLEFTQGLVYLHDKGILHRDLKAENILIDANGCAKLADLGVAQADTLLAETEAKVVAKGLQDKHFIAPENIKDQTLSNVKTDIYALGLVLWQLAAGRLGVDKPLPRFPGTELSMQQCREWSQGLVLAEREPIPADCPTGFRELILSCWQHDPQKRPTANVLLERLHTLGKAPDINHPEPALLATCEQLTLLIHAKRLEGLSYVAPYLTQYALSETIDYYWRRVEMLTDPKQDGNPPLDLLPTLDRFVEDANASCLLLLGDSGLGKTLSTYLLADRLLAHWLAYLNDPRQPMPAYLPVFVRPALSQWSHTVLREEGFAKVLDFYKLSEKHPFGLLLIVDGYDECQVGDAPIGNLVNQLGIPLDANVKLLVTCRPHTVAKEQLKERFAFNDQLQTNYFLPFKLEQMLTYLTTQLNWDTETQATYRADLEKATALRTVLRNPFVLHLFVQSFPTLKNKKFQQLNRWQIYESAVEEWLGAHQGLLSPTVQQKLTGGQTDHVYLVKSFTAFASMVAFTAFQQGKIALSQDDVAKLDSSWGRLSSEVKQDGQETFQGYKLSLCTIRKETPLSLAEQLNYLERHKKKLTLPALIAWQTPEEGAMYFVYGLAANSKPQLTPLPPDVLPIGLVFKKGDKLFVSAQQHPTLYQALTDTQAHVKSADRRSLLSEGDYLIILGERCQQFGLGSPLKQRSEGVEFTHKSFFEYFMAKRLIQLNQLSPQEAEKALQVLLNLRSVREEPEVLAFWVEGWQSSSGSYPLIEPLFRVITASRNNAKGKRAASNAATLLARVRVAFAGRDLHQVAIPEADLSEAFCFDTQFQGADVRGVNFKGAYLSEANFIDAQMKGVTFGEYPSLVSKSEVYCVCYSSDGQMMAVVEKNITLYQKTITRDASENTETTYLKCGELQGHFVSSVAFSPDGLMLASGSSKTVWLWDAKNHVALGKLQGHTKGVTSVAFSPDGVLLASGSDDNTVRLWDAKNHVALGKLEGHTKCVNSVAFSPDGVLLASGSVDSTVRLWDAKNYVAIGKLEGHTKRVRSVAFSPDGVLLASGSNDGTVRLWDAKNHVALGEIQGHTESVNSVAFSPDGVMLVSGSGDFISSYAIPNDCVVRLWDAKNFVARGVLQEYTTTVLSVVFSPDQVMLASGSCGIKNDINYGVMRLWNVNSQAALDLQEHTAVNSVAFSSDGLILASGSSDKTVRLWDVNDSVALGELQGHTDVVRSVAFSSDGLILASGSSDKTVRLWDANGQMALGELQGHTDVVNSVAFSPDGVLLASGSYDKTVRLWDAKTQVALSELQGHTDSVNSVAFSPDGVLLASGSDDNTVRLWDVKTQVALGKLQGHMDSVNSVAFSPDGVLASGSRDYAVFLWARTSAGSLYLDKWMLIYRFANSTGLVTKNLYLNGAKLSEGNRQLLEQRGANFDERPSSIQVSLFGRFFSPEEDSLGEVGRRVAGYLPPQDRQAMTCVNRGCHGFFMVLRKEAEIKKEATLKVTLQF